MPFTPAHSAAVLPFLNRKYFSATALIAGSIAPDFEYFFRLNVKSIYSHTIPGLFYFDIPVAVLISLLFHLVVKKNLIGNLPGFLQSRFQDTLNLDFNKALRDKTAIVILSALAGAFTHIFWDSFTHNNGYFARTLDIYKTAFVTIMDVRYPLFFILQQLSTTVGLLLVMIFVIAKKPVTNVATSDPSLAYWTIVVAVTAATVVLRFSIFSGRFLFGNLIVTCVSGFCLGLIIAALLQPNKKELKTF